MPVLPRHSVVIALLLAVTACASDEPDTVMAPAAAPAITLVRVGNTPDEGAIDTIMGATLGHVLRVRAVDAQGTARRDVPVRFRVHAGDGARLGSTATDAEIDVVRVTDADGEAAVAYWTLPTRDTIATEHLVEAQLLSDASRTVTFRARAWRDLSHFGGTTPMTFDRLPVSRGLISAILPLGTFGTDDALPSADALLQLRDAGRVEVAAIADGLITELDARSGALTLRVRDHMRVRIGGIQLGSDLWVGRVLRAGTIVGTVDASNPDARVGVRLLDTAVVRTRWVRPERYGARRNAGFFVRYLADSLRSEALALVRRASPDLDGRIDYDRDGRLVGTWFSTSAPVPTPGVEGFNAAATVRGRDAADMDPSSALASLALTFAYDAERPGQVRVAAGAAIGHALAQAREGVPGMQGAWAVAWEDPDPAEVDASGGITRYRLYPQNDEVRIGAPTRVLLVQLVSAHSLLVEVVEAGRGETAAFSARATTLVR